MFLPTNLLPQFLVGFRAPARYPRLGWAIWLMMLALAVIWPVPNEMLPFHRNMILLPCFLALVYLVVREPDLWRSTVAVVPRRLLWLVLALTLWTFVIGLWKGDTVSSSLIVFNGKWLRVLETGFIGLMLSRVLLRRPDNRLTAADLFFGVVCCMWLLPVIQVWHEGQVWLHTHNIAWAETWIAATRMEASVAFGMLISFLCAEIGTRLAIKRHWLPVSWPILLAMTVIVFGAQLSLQTRNATIGMAGSILSISLLLLMVRARQWKWHAIVAVVLVTLLGLFSVAWISWHSDPRWQSLKQTFPAALDTKHNLAWLDYKKYPYPTLADGEIAAGSNYERIAWLKIGSWLILKEPLGNGLHGDNFHRLVERYFGPTTTTQSHSGMINFALAVGIPGLLMWLAILGYLARIGWVQFFRYGRMPGLFLMVYVFSTGMRSMVDDIWRDHMLEQFFFFSAFLLVAALQPDSGRRDAVGADGADAERPEQG